MSQRSRIKHVLSRHPGAVVPAAALVILALIALIFGHQLWAWFSLEPMGGGGRSEIAATRAGALQIEAAVEPDPPRQKGNVVHLSLTDAQGKPVEGAAVTVEYDMPAMGQMAEMRGGADVSAQGAGHYRAAFDLPMAGSWTLIVTVQAGSGAATTARYGFTVGSKGLIAQGAAGGGPVAASAPTATTAASGVDSATAAPAGQPGAAGASASEAAVITIDQGRRQQIGVKTGTVKRADLSLEVRAVGKVTYDERSLRDVSLKYKGWIQHLTASATGQPVKKGQVLFTIYSPELYAAEGEYLLALASAKRDGGSPGPGAGASGRAGSLVQAAREKLLLWDLTPGQVDRLAGSGTPQKYVPVLAPASGYVIEKNVVEGAAVEPGRRLYRIAPRPIWIEAEVYEPDLPQIQVGQRAVVSLADVPGQAFTGKVAFVYPYLDPASRTGKVRVVLKNPSLALKPDMYADVTLEANLGKRLVVPASAIIYTGPRRIVFRRPRRAAGSSRSRSRSAPRAATRSRSWPAWPRATVIVTSGNFLVAAESRIRSALELWQGGSDDDQ